MANGYRCETVTRRAFSVRQWSHVAPAACAADVLRDRLLRVIDGAAPLADATLVVAPLCDVHAARLLVCDAVEPGRAAATATTKKPKNSQLLTEAAQRRSLALRHNARAHSGVSEKYVALHRDARPQLCACRLTSLPEPLFAQAPEPPASSACSGDSSSTSSYFSASLGGS